MGLPALTGPVRRVQGQGCEQCCAGKLRYADAVPASGNAAGYVAGGLWLLAAVLFVAAAVLLVAGRAAWRLTALAAVLASVPVIGLMPGQAVRACHRRADPGPGRRQLAARPPGGVMTASLGPSLAR